MEISISAIIEPANQLILLLILPKVAYFCAIFAYEGLKNGVSLTHFGMRKGMLARIYGFFYLLICILVILEIPFDIRNFLAINPVDIQTALLFAIPLPEAGFLWIGLSFVLFLFVEGLRRFGQKKATKKTFSIQSTRKFQNWLMLFPLALGVQAFLGLPEWVNVGIFAFFIYFAPLFSPREIKKALRIPDEKPVTQSV